MTRQFDKKHAETVVATAAIAVNRFVCRAGTHAPAAPANGNQDSIGISEEAGAIGEAIPAVTRYSYLVEASAAITKGAYLKPAADVSGKAAVGAIGDHCAVAMTAASVAGQLVEAQIVKHVHA